MICEKVEVGKIFLEGLKMTEELLTTADASVMAL